MSLTPIAINEILPATWTSAADFLTSFHTYVTTTSTTLAVDLVAAGGAGDGFALTFVADPGAQYIWRRTGALTINMSIEPSGSVTVIGTTGVPPTGTSSDWSDERTFTMGTLAAGSKIWLTEHSDALTMKFKSSTGTSWQNSFQTGRIIQPDYPNVDEPLGFDGLAFVIGSPRFSTGADDFLQQPNSSYTDANSGLMHCSDGVWRSLSGCSYYNTDAASDDVTYTPYIRPSKIAVAPVLRNGYPPYRQWGTMKYMMRAGDGRAPVQRIDINNATDLAWITGGLVNSTSPTNNITVFPWLRAQVP
jgi:hypothetical protein